MKTIQILLSTDFKIGDRIGSILNEKYESDERIYYIVVGYEITGMDETGQVTDYLIKAQGQTGEITYFYPTSIEKT